MTDTTAVNMHSKCDETITALGLERQQLIEHTHQLVAERDHLLRELQDIRQLHANQACSISAYIAEVEQLTNDLANQSTTISACQTEADGLRQELNRVRLAHITDVQTIGEWLIKLAEDRGFCEEYDRLIDEVNGKLSVELPVRSYSGTVGIELSITIHADIDECRRSDLAAFIEDHIQGTREDFDHAFQFDTYSDNANSISYSLRSMRVVRAEEI